VVQTPDLRN